MPTFGNAFCCINKDPPNIAQFTAIRGRNIPNEAYNEGAYFSTTISTSCTKEAITAINIINERKLKLIEPKSAPNQDRAPSFKT